VRRYLPPLISATLVLAVLGSANAKEIQTGRFTATFDQRNPHSTLKSLHKRFRHRPDKSLDDYDIKAEQFHLYVPHDYDPTEKYGLIVWVHSRGPGEPSDAYLSILDKHHLIWVGIDRPAASNNVWHVMGLAIDAAYNLTRRYKIDRKRIYIAGQGQGGGVASRLGVGVADIFQGALISGSVEFFRNVDVRRESRTYWVPGFHRPQGKSVGLAIKRSRFVFLVDYDETGGHSHTRDTINNGYRRLRFKYVNELRVPVAGQTPGAPIFDQAVTLLDAPLAR